MHLIHPRTWTKALMVTLLLAPAALGEGTRTWQRTRFEDFEKGEAKGVAISSDGALLLAPALQPLASTPSAYLWAIATGADGSVYAAAGSPARVYRITPDGQLTAIFAPQELLVQALAVDKSGAVFAATSPDGKVYKIERRKAAPPADAKPAEDVDPNFTASVFFEPKSKYIWDLKLDSEGRLYVATGDRGELYRVGPDGTGSVFFNSDETHIRTLAIDLKGNLLAGSDPSGLIYRITPAGEAFVLYSAPRKEITALAVDSAGNIYAAGVGQKAPAAPQQPRMPQTIVPGMAVGGTVGGVVSGAIISLSAQPGLAPMPAPMPFGQAIGSDVYRIAAEGAPRRIWSSNEDLVYSLAFDASGRLLAGTGNKGRVFALAENGDFTDLLQASAAQVTGLAAAAGGRVIAATSNLGKVFVLGGAREASAEAWYQSDVFDAGNFSRWGRAEVRGSGSFDFFVRSGNVENPSRNWSPWKKVDLARGAAVDAPPARFLQWKVVLRAGEPAARVESVTMNYRPQNVPPSVDDVAVQVGARFPAVVRPAMEQVPVVVGGDNNPQPQPTVIPSAPGALRDSDSVAVRWNAHDDNDDDLIYSVYYRGDGETRWRLLKDKITDKFYSFDRDLLPDGGYTMKVVASDSPSNPAGEGLTDDKESARFELDSTPPVIEGLSATVSAGKVHVTFRAADAFSPIAHAEYSVDAGDWQVLEPVGRISDSKSESYDFTAAVPPAAESPAAGENPAEHIVVVRVYDRYENVGSGKVVVRPR
jgi:outer membrane protein assembly factor BamB